MLFRLLKFTVTGNIWGGQQSLPRSGANVPPEFTILTECRCKQNESDVVKGRPDASSASLIF